MDEDLVTVHDLVRDRTDGRIAWAVVAAFARGPQGEPICVDYRVRAVKALHGNYDGEYAGQRNGQVTVRVLKGQAETEWPGDGPYSRKGIPRYVFEAASQQRLILKARDWLDRNPDAAPKARRVMDVPARRTGRPPTRSPLEKLRILADVEAAYESGRTLSDVAAKNHMSRSAVRDLLSWARGDANPQLFEGITPGRKGGKMTPAARELLERLEAD